jgi:hypothetical protein
MLWILSFVAMEMEDLKEKEGFMVLRCRDSRQTVLSSFERS